MRTAIWVFVVLLLVIHQDNWFWTDGRLILGFLPIGLFYHAGISIAAAIVWWLATKYCWPENLELPPQEDAA